VIRGRADDSLVSRGRQSSWLCSLDDRVSGLQSSERIESMSEGSCTLLPKPQIPLYPPHLTTPHHTTPHPPTNHLTHLSHIPTKLTHFLTLSSIFYLLLNDNEITIKSLLLNTVSYLERYIGENRAAQSYFCQPFLSLLLLFVSTSLSGQLKLVHTQKARALCAVGKCCSFRWFTTFYCDKQLNVTKGKGWVVFNALTSKGG